MSDKDTLIKWVIDELWPAYRGLVETPYKDRKHGPGVRGECVAKVLSMRPSSALRAEIMQAIKDQKLARVQAFINANKTIPLYNQINLDSPDTKFFSNRHGRTWLHNRGWEDEIPELTIKRPRQSTEKQCLECGQPTHGGRYKYCIDHLQLQSIH